MENLRWIILTAGIVVVLIVYFSGRSRNKSVPFQDKINADDLPSIKTGIPEQHVDVDLQIKADDESSDLPGISTSNDAETNASESMQENTTEEVDDLVMIQVVARKAYFNGEELSRLINHQQLKFGDMEIYHAYDEHGQITFSMSNLLKPGHFYPEKLDSMQTPGVIFFMQCSLVTDPVSGFNRMLNCAETFVRELDGELRDAKRHKLDDVAIDALRQKVAEFSADHQPYSAD